MPLPSLPASPKVSLLFFVYNHGSFVEAALISALHQDLGQYELVVVDDASSDGSRAIMEVVLAREAPAGVSVLRLYKEKNGGLLAAVNDAMALAGGDVFVMMAGDDVSMPDRLRRTLRLFIDAPEVALVYGEVAIIDELGKVLRSSPSETSPKRFAYSSRSFGGIYARATPCGASAAYRRELFDVFGPMRDGTHGEDNCYWIRALLVGEIHHDPACFIHWRKHSANLSNFRTTSDDSWRRQHLVWMEKHAGMSPQWLSDIATAQARGFISQATAMWLRILALREDRSWALEASTLRRDPWGQWFTRAYQLLRVGRISRTIKLFKSRLFRRRHQRMWANWEKHRSNTTA